MKQEQLSTEIRECISNFNRLLLLADELKLRVKTKQEFHPFINSVGTPLNPPLSAYITETIE